MNKNFSYYLKIWAILFILFNLIVFALPVRYNDWYKFGGAFWSGYVCITISFAVQILVSYASLKETDKTKLLYKIPLVQKSFTALIIMIILGSVCMFYPDLNMWIGAIVGIALLAVEAITLINADKVVKDVAGVEEKVKTNTNFIKNITVEAQTIMNNATDETKDAYKKVHEALRYSDPMSNELLKDVEDKISIKFNELKNNFDTDKADELVNLITERNNKCKELK